METKFTLREQIVKEHSKAACVRIVKWVGDDQKRFDELFDLFLHAEYHVVQHAAWPVSYCVIAHPQLINKHWKSLLFILKQPHIHNAVKRNSMRFLQEVDIPEKYQGTIMDICFKYLESPAEAIAVRAFSLTVLANLSKLYPEIIPEVRTVLEQQFPKMSAAVKVRARPFMKGS